MRNTRSTRLTRPCRILGAALLAVGLTIASVGSNAGAASLRERSERVKYERMKMSKSLRQRLEEKKRLAIEGRLPEDDPRPVDYSGLTHVLVPTDPAKVEKPFVPEPFLRPRPLTGYVSGDVLQLVQLNAKHYDVDENLILGMIQQESSFNPVAVSTAGARGLMQLMPATAAWLGVEDSFDPAQNIAGGTKYISMQLKEFGDVKLALAAYNAGPARIKRRLRDGKPFPEETQDYMVKVLRYRDEFAAGTRKVRYAASGKKPKAKTLPAYDGATYVVTLKGGSTQRAEVLIEDGDLLLGSFKNQDFRIRIADVTEIEEAS